MRQAVILAGGRGTRLQSRLGLLPKPMIDIGGKPLLQHQIELCRKHSVTHILILAGYRAEVIRDFCGDGSRWGLRIDVEIEAAPAGTAGAVLRCLDHLPETFLVLYGDEMLNVDLDRFWEVHATMAGAATLLLHPNDHPFDSDLVEVDPSGWITAFHNRPHPPGRSFQNLVNAALYIINKSALRNEPPVSGPLDFGKDVFPALLRAGKRLFGYRSPEYIKDIGTPERHDKICAEFAAGLVASSSLAVPQKAAILDRDGTLVREVDPFSSPEQLELLPGVAAAVRRLNHSGHRAIVATNQPVIAKGFCTEAQLREIHNRLESLLGREGAFLDRIYYCPHHPDKGFPGEQPELKIVCECRKPAPGMILAAQRELALDLSQSWMIGDSTADLQAAANAGLRSILVKTGNGGRDGKYPAKPDHVCDDLASAVEVVIRDS